MHFPNYVQIGLCIVKMAASREMYWSIIMALPMFHSLLQVYSFWNWKFCLKFTFRHNWLYIIKNYQIRDGLSWAWHGSDLVFRLILINKFVDLFMLFISLFQFNLIIKRLEWKLIYTRETSQTLHLLQTVSDLNRKYLIFCEIINFHFILKIKGKFHNFFQLKLYLMISLLLIISLKFISGLSQIF